jgi:hypothetical protein
MFSVCGDAKKGYARKGGENKPFFCGDGSELCTTSFVLALSEVVSARRGFHP